MAEDKIAPAVEVVDKHAPSFVRQLQTWAKHVGSLARAGHTILDAVVDVLGGLSDGLRAVADRVDAGRSTRTSGGS